MTTLPPSRIYRRGISWFGLPLRRVRTDGGSLKWSSWFGFLIIKQRSLRTPDFGWTSISPTDPLSFSSRQNSLVKSTESSLCMSKVLHFCQFYRRAICLDSEFRYWHGRTTTPFPKKNCDDRRWRHACEQNRGVVAASASLRDLCVCVWLMDCKYITVLARYTCSKQQERTENDIKPIDLLEFGDGNEYPVLLRSW